MNEHRDIVEAIYSRNFQYATILDLENEGLVCGSDTDDMISEPRAIFLIQTFSEYINGLCGRWFEPLHLTFGLKSNDSIFSTPNLIPIIDLFSISKITNGERRYLERGQYRNNYTNIELSSKSYGLSNYLIDGVFGLIENMRFLETKLSEDFELEKDKKIEVEDVSPKHKYRGISGISPRFQSGDLIIFENEDGEELGRRMVQKVDYEESTMEINPYTEGEIFTDTFSEGTVVRTYGRVPNLIKMATVQFVVDNYMERASEDFWAEQLKRRLKGEKTDHYSWETHTMRGGGGYALPDVTLTSDPIINRALVKYSAPGWIRRL